MAALDFGMALARGILPQSEKAQKDLLDLAGGRNIFKSEDWWNTQVDKQISEGYREAKQETQYLTESGYKPRAGTTTSYGNMISGQFQRFGTFGGISLGKPSPSPIYGYDGGVQLFTSDILPQNVVKKNGIVVSRQIDVFKDASRKDYTAGELSDIESSAERGAERIRRESAKMTAAQKRLRRGTGGLVGKARLPGEAPSTGLPELGTTGLAMTGGLFGVETKL